VRVCKSCYGAAGFTDKAGYQPVGGAAEDGKFLRWVGVCEAGEFAYVAAGELDTSDVLELC
jgi:hypothetical protein